MVTFLWTAAEADSGDAAAERNNYSHAVGASSFIDGFLFLLSCLCLYVWLSPSSFSAPFRLLLLRPLSPPPPHQSPSHLTFSLDIFLIESTSSLDVSSSPPPPPPRLPLVSTSFNILSDESQQNASPPSSPLSVAFNVYSDDELPPP